MNGTPDTRIRILEAGLELISERGYLGASTREIAEKAGFSELTLFRKFGNKETLFEAILETFTFLPRLKALLVEVEELPLESALQTIGVGFIETLVERKKFVKIIITEINVYPEKIRKIHASVIEGMETILGEYFQKLQSRGAMRPFPPDVASRAFFRMLFAYFLRECVLKGKEISKQKTKKEVTHYIDIFLNGLAPKDSLPGGQECLLGQ